MTSIVPAARRRFDADFLARWDAIASERDGPRAEGVGHPAERGRGERSSGEIGASGRDGVLVRVGGEPILLRLQGVREIVPAAPLAPYAGAPPDVLGLLNLRGEVLTVVSPNRVLGRRVSPAEFFAVVEAAGVRFALAVEGMIQTVRIPEAGGAQALPILDTDLLAESLFETEAP
ncbi:MAG: chemotaxis protein CheW [Gemmatimonadetes bacterium]|nr:chemotaxis protein CheW [Gemmatimonadota bacterium]